MRVASKVVIIVFLVLIGLLGFVCLTQQRCFGISLVDEHKLEGQQIRAIVDKINLITGLPQKQGEPQWDEHAAAIVKLGKKAGPFLVEKITDTSLSKVVEFFQYKIGDVALSLLNDIYQPQSWPFPDASAQMPKKYDDFRDYVDFINSEGARERIKESWKTYIRTH
jgi:hypothetical protein